MQLFNAKKGEAVLAVILIIIIIVIFLGWLVNVGTKECRSNSECRSDNYCGSDFTCHQIPVIEKTIVKNNLIVPSLIIGLAIVIAAIVLKSGKFRFRKKSQEQGYEQKHIKSFQKMP
ncbi:MAG: hypothetical protein QF436_00125 [Candidatus Woesearchaeota archaeon]|jgi:hypothetical protein|nr:hypothetical protein [Candidatus Woesearchaeota archaeon]MDP7622512.1 hypothetical protein [Candidatus Woesearchaeota archaeon]HJN56590.1 hypothetical protein [Candidatus Woesearchaeota archaeon]|tara:strand:- start:43728 stop:44078 length:351 start_codon:yes stop_codon:yes gene_type:complete